jgi:hypothetical protein
MMVAKIFWAEEQRTNEPDILNKVYEIADSKPDTIKGHGPKLESCLVFESLPSSISLYSAGPRPITELHGKDFFNVWQQ